MKHPQLPRPIGMERSLRDRQFQQQQQQQQQHFSNKLQGWVDLLLWVLGVD